MERVKRSHCVSGWGFPSHLLLLYFSIPPQAPDFLEGASKAPFLQYILFGNPLYYFAWQAQGPEVDSPNPHKKTNTFLTGIATQSFMGLDV